MSKPTFELETNYDLAGAVSICREIEKIVSKIGYHTALTGSTLYKGKSDDDIDIIIYPHNNAVLMEPSDVMYEICGHSHSPACKEDYDQSEGYRIIFKASYKRNQVDFFFL